MASSFSQKSNSSGSKGAKPTFRRASSARSPRSSSGSRPASASARPAAPRPPSPRTAVRSGSGRSAAARPAPSRPAVRSVPHRAGAPAASHPISPRKRTSHTAPRTVPATVKAAPRRTSAPSVQPAPSRPLAKGPSSARPILRMPKVGAPKRPQGGAAGPARPKPQKAAGAPAPLARAFSGAAAVLGRLPLPHLKRGPVLIAAGVLVLLALVALVVANSPLLAATDIQVKGSAHVDQQTVEQLVQVPDGTTLLNVDEASITASLTANPWIDGVQIERKFPHTLIITPHERTVRAVAYITSDDIAWAISDDGIWIAPLSLSVAVDAEGNEVAASSDGSWPEGATVLSGVDAALQVARDNSALLLTDVPSDANPSSGKAVSSEVVLAGLEYARGFSSSFLEQVKDLSIASVEAISANLTSGVEVSLGDPDNITEKERVVTRLLEEQTGVTYINVREPGAYTFRSAPQ